jgi:Zn-finger nucleic acid-binding protein
MFLGSAFCGRCGAKAVPAEIVTDKNAGECPRCNLPLHVLRIAEINIRDCEKCGGLWAGVQTFENLCANKEQQSSVLGFVSNQKHQIEQPGEISYVPCPDCKNLMNRSNFARSSGVIIDLCKKHGVWFDADELPKIIEFINGGGLARAREMEKLQLQQQRQQLTEEQRNASAPHPHLGADSWWDDEDQWGVGKFVRLLFD